METNLEIKKQEKTPTILIPEVDQLCIGSAKEFESLEDVFEEKTGEYLYSRVK